MPPPMALSSQMVALRPVTTALRCATFSAASSTRQFTTSQAREQVQIPPESPKFINIPEPPQSKELPKIRNKGRLPVPRQIFDLRKRPPGTPNHGRQDPRLQDGYVDTVMPRSKAELAGEAKVNSPLQEWRKKVTDNRRAALEAGLEGLYNRQRQKDQTEREQKERMRRTRARARYAPERRDERLTRSTVRASTLETKVELDPLRHERAAESAKRTAAVLEARAERRRDALQELYIAAKDFIVTEEELAKRIDLVFSEEYFGRHPDPNTGVRPVNMWETEGIPLKVSDLMDQFSRNIHDATVSSGETREAKRQKNVSEELTGGKL